MELKDKIESFGQLTLKIRELKAKLGELQTEKDRLEREIRLDLESAGLDKATVNGITVYTRDDYFFRVVNPDEAYHFLVEHDLDDLIETTVKPQKLRGVFASQVKNGEITEEELKQNGIDVVKKERIGSRIKNS